jgi:hypothetical protein
LIADHARKDTPPGSYSWEFIEKSVKSGQLLENLEDFLIRPRAPRDSLAGSARPTGSARPPRGTRSSFTKEDDAILMKWVTLQERRGEPISGNKVYQEFAEKVGKRRELVSTARLLNYSQHPNHTWQSWRDRWVKKLSLLPRPKAGNEDHDGGEDELDDANEPPSPPTAAQVASQEPNRKATTPKGVGSKTRTPFTEQDDKLLESYVGKCLAKGGRVLGNKIYLDFAEQVLGSLVCLQGWHAAS